jgi:cbb3-type cytochrome oxidase maturation protein
MEIIILLIGISLTMALAFLGLFIWNIRSGQYEDTYTPSVRILFGEKKNGASEQEKNPEIKEPDIEVTHAESH